MIVESVFWFSLFFVFYAYFGYPLSLGVLSLFRDRAVKKGIITPQVSFIITAHNEEKNIGKKLENTLGQDYPKDRFEIIVASDCSSDGTDDVVRSYEPKGVRLVRALERKGKENAQKQAIDAANGEILVFSDVATVLASDGISKIVRSFNDPTVGCVSSVDRFIDKGGNPGGEGVYVRYEMLLRDLETRVNTVVGLSGSLFAARREVCQNWVIGLQSDFNTLLNSVRLGFRGVSDPDSVGYYMDIANKKKEFDRKVRTVLRGIAVFMKSVPLLNPLRYGLFSWQLFSHKLCRWLVPFAMIAALVSNAVLAAYSKIYFYVFLFQAGFYLLALAGVYTDLLASNLFRIPSFFVMVNISILNAWYRYIRGERLIAWEPSKR